MYFEEGGDWVIVLYKPCGMVFLSSRSISVLTERQVHESDCDAWLRLDSV